MSVRLLNVGALDISVGPVEPKAEATAVIWVRAELLFRS